MKYAENLLKEKINNAVSGEGVDEDVLWGSIEHKLIKSKGSILTNWKFIGLLLVGMASILVFYNINTINEESMSKIVLRNDNELKDIKRNNTFLYQPTNGRRSKKIEAIGKLGSEKDTELNYSNNKESSSNLITNISIKKQSNLILTSSDKIRTNREYLMTKARFNEEKVSLSQLQSSKIIDKIKSYNIGIDNKTNFKQSFINGPNNSVIKKNLSSNLTSNNIKPLKTLVTLLSLEQKQQVIELLIDYNNHSLLLTERNKIRSPWSIVLGSGVNWMVVNIEKKEGKNVFGDVNKAKISFNGSLDIVYNFNENVTISSGLYFSNIKEHFEYSSTLHFQKVDSLRLIKYDLDMNSGDSINLVYGQRKLNYKAVRTVKHKNNFKILSLPISFGITKSYNNINLGSEIGLNINYLISQNGKFLDDNLSVVEFESEAKGSLPFRKLFLGIHIKPFLEYKIDSNVSLRLSSSVSYQFLGISELYQVNQKGILLRFSGGIKYSF